LVLLAVLGSAPASAGGLYVWEFGQPAQGASGAGAGALAEDASTAFLNPAGIVFMEEPDILVSGIVIDSSVEFRQNANASGLPPAVADAEGNRPAGDGGDGGSTAVGGGFFYARPVNEKWGWGVSVGSISGAALEHQQPADFAGRYWATEVELLTINVTPSVAYRVSDNFSVGFAVPAMLGTLDMDVSIPGAVAGGGEGQAEIMDGEDIEFTFSVSAMWQATERVRFGAMYLGEVDIEFDSDLRLTLPPGQVAEDIAADVSFTYPQTVRTWGAFELNDRVTLLGTIAWEDWSAFDTIAISTPGPSGALPRNWDDTWHYSAGVKIKTGGPWTWYTGIAYDTDPTRAKDRTADMPIDEQWRLSFGANRERSNGHRWGLVATYADYGDAEIDNGGTRPISGAPWTVKGDYSTNRILFLGFNYGW
jgi:long-chain fatty acid transport protein